MEVILSTLQADAYECEILVVGFFEDERPLRGSTGWVDWRLNGVLSRYLLEKKLLGIWKEMILIPSQARILSPLILLVGLGKSKGIQLPSSPGAFPFPPGDTGKVEGFENLLLSARRRGTPG